MSRKLNDVKNIARNRGIENWDTLKVSNVKNKRFSIISPKGKLINFGLWPFKDGTFIDHGDVIKRYAWKQRHSKILKNGKPAYLNPESPSFYSYNLLW